jgi:hypothetical protein
MTKAHGSDHAPKAPDTRLNNAIAQLRTTAAPLLQPLNLSELTAAGVNDAGDQTSPDQSS